MRSAAGQVTNLLGFLGGQADEDPVVTAAGIPYPQLGIENHDHGFIVTRRTDNPRPPVATRRAFPIRLPSPRSPDYGARSAAGGESVGRRLGTDRRFDGYDYLGTRPEIPSDRFDRHLK
ncbi:hypothetical protein GCM10027521_51140 [Amycolatopsis cihanbeyliensis]